MDLVGLAVKDIIRGDKNVFTFTDTAGHISTHDIKRYLRKPRQLVYLEKQLIKRANGNILDIGCATGYYLPLLMKKGKTIGLDISDSLIDIARKNGLKNCFVYDTLILSNKYKNMKKIIITHDLGLYPKDMKELLNIVDNDDKIIGEKTREEIHQGGLLHREIHVYFITPNKEFIFQHRAKDKDTYPNLLDATVGGHVEIGDSYEKTAIKETVEETGISIDLANLILLGKTQRRSEDRVTGKINNTIRQSYLYIFKGEMNNLKIEEGKSLGFEIWPIERLLFINDDDSKRFIPYILEFSKTEVAKYINNLKL